MQRKTSAVRHLTVALRMWGRWGHSPTKTTTTVSCLVIALGWVVLALVLRVDDVAVVEVVEVAEVVVVVAAEVA